MSIYNVNALAYKTHDVTTNETTRKYDNGSIRYILADTPGHIVWEMVIYIFCFFAPTHLPNENLCQIIEVGAKHFLLLVKIFA